MHSRAAPKFRKRLRKPQNPTKYQLKESNVGQIFSQGCMAAHQLQTMQGTGFLLLRRPEQCWRSIWIDSAGGQRANISVIRVTAIPPPFGGKGWRTDPMGPLLRGPVKQVTPTHCNGERRGQPMCPSQKLTAALWCVSVAAPWWPARHLTKITPGTVCPIKKAFAGLNWTTGKRKTPNKEAAGKGVYSSPFSRDRWISLTFFLNLN